MEAWGPPEGAPEGHWGSLGGPWRAPGGSPEAPWWVLGTALGGFGGDWGEQPPKKWPGPISLTVLDPKRCKMGGPRDPFWEAKSLQNRIKILMRFWDRFWEFLSTLEGQKAVFSLECCLKMKVGLFATESVRGRFWEPSGGPRGTPGGSLERPWAVLGAIGANSRPKSSHRQSPSTIFGQQLCQKGEQSQKKWPPSKSVNHL